MNPRKPLAFLPVTLAAATLLSLAGLAQAQSSVTLYGLIDLNVSNYAPGSRIGGGSRTLMQDGTTNGLNGSRWGIRVAEDLGGGWKTTVVLEGGILADTGSSAQGGRSFGRQAFVSLGSPTFGEVRLGRQYILEDYVMGLTDPMGNALVSNPSTGVTNAGRALPLWLNAPRADNVVQYRTPTWSGFSLAAQVAPGESTADRFHGVQAAYALGKVNTALSYEWNKSRVTGQDTNKSLTFGANYDFGGFKLLGGVQRNRDLATGSGNGAAVGVSNLIVTGSRVFTMNRLDGYTLGVEVPWQAWTWGASYTSVKYEASNGQDATLGKASLVARYGLSKNTFLYAGVSMATGDLKDWISEKRVINGGVRVAF